MTVKYKQDSKTKQWTARVWWMNANKERCSEQKSGFQTKRAAQAWAQDRVGAGEDSTLKGAQKLKLGDFLDQWIAIKEKSLSLTTISGYKVNISKIKNALGNVPIMNLRLPEIQQFIDSQSDVVVKKEKKKSEVGSRDEDEVIEIKASPRTVKYTFRTLHAALEYAIKSQLIKSNPSDYVELPAENKFTPATLSAADIIALLDALRACRHEIYLPVLLSVMHGLRRGEALGLRWSDIDFEQGIMHINSNYTVAENKKILKSVKTKESDAIIPMAVSVSKELRSIRDEQLASGKIEEFVCATDGELPDPRHISEKLHRFQKANNLPICRFHDLRHSFAGVARDNGIDLDTLKRLMRHSKIGITSDLYLHNNVSGEKSASKKVEKALSNVKKLRKDQHN